MSSPSHSALIRGVTFLLLLWVGLDLGAHGLFASDLHPISARGVSVGGATVEDGATSQSPDHCFCHSQSLGATLPAPVVRPEWTDLLVSVVPCQEPRSAARPLYHPPQILA